MTRAACRVCLGLLFLMAGSMAWAIVGNPVALTEQAERHELRGNYTAAAQARRKAISYARRTLDGLAKALDSTKKTRDKKLAQSVLAENQRWIAEDDAGGGKLKQLVNQMQWVLDRTNGVAAAEERWHQARQQGQADDATQALSQAIELRAGFVRELRSKVQSFDAAVQKKETGWAETKLKAEYLRGVLARWEWSLEELRAAQ